MKIRIRFEGKMYLRNVHRILVASCCTDLKIDYALFGYWLHLLGFWFDSLTFPEIYTELLNWITKMAIYIYIIYNIYNSRKIWSIMKPKAELQVGRFGTKVRYEGISQYPKLWHFLDLDTNLQYGLLIKTKQIRSKCSNFNLKLCLQGCNVWEMGSVWEQGVELWCFYYKAYSVARDIFVLVWCCQNMKSIKLTLLVTILATTFLNYHLFFFFKFLCFLY